MGTPLLAFASKFTAVLVTKAKRWIPKHPVDISKTTCSTQTQQVYFDLQKGKPAIKKACEREPLKET